MTLDAWLLAAILAAIILQDPRPRALIRRARFAWQLWRDPWLACTLRRAWKSAGTLGELGRR